MKCVNILFHVKHRKENEKMKNREKELLRMVLSGFYVNEYGLEWSFMDDFTLGAFLGKDIEKELYKYLNEDQKNDLKSYGHV